MQTQAGREEKEQVEFFPECKHRQNGKRKSKLSSSRKVSQEKTGREKERGMYLEEIIKELKQEEKQLFILQQKIEKQLQNLPDGRLKIRTRNGKPEYHIITSDGKEKYIRKEQKELVGALAQKSYLKKSLSNISPQLSTIRQFLNNLRNCKRYHGNLRHWRRC